MGARDSSVGRRVLFTLWVIIMILAVNCNFRGVLVPESTLDPPVDRTPVKRSAGHRFLAPIVWGSGISLERVLKLGKAVPRIPVNH